MSTVFFLLDKKETDAPPTHLLLSFTSSSLVFRFAVNSQRTTTHVLFCCVDHLVEELNTHKAATGAFLVGHAFGIRYCTDYSCERFEIPAELLVVRSLFTEAATKGSRGFLQTDYGLPRIERHVILWPRNRFGSCIWYLAMVLFSDVRLRTVNAYFTDIIKAQNFDGDVLKRTISCTWDAHIMVRVKDAVGAFKKDIEKATSLSAGCRCFLF